MDIFRFDCYLKDIFKWAIYVAYVSSSDQWYTLREGIEDLVPLARGHLLSLALGSEWLLASDLSYESYNAIYEDGVDGLDHKLVGLLFKVIYSNPLLESNNARCKDYCW